MAKFDGFVCDHCETVKPNSERTVMTVRFDGPATQGFYEQELCPDCVFVPEDVTLRPLRRRGPNKAQPGATPVPD